MLKVICGLAVCAVLGGCAGIGTDFPVGRAAQVSDAARADIPFVVVPVTTRNAKRLSPRPGNGGPTTRLPQIGRWQYHIGVGDILSVLVYNHPELTLPAGPQRSAAESGQPVENDGTFFYPYVGKIPAAGLALADIRADLTKKLGKYIPDPQVDVHVAAYNSQSVSVTGEVKTPARERLTDLPLTLLQAVDAAGGLTPDADTANVTVRRHGRLYRVDLKAFLASGQVRNNPVLVEGDVVNVPKQQPVVAYVLGQVSKPAPVDLSQAPVTLTGALTAQGGLVEADANARGVFVFRKPSKGPIKVYQLDARSPIAFVAGSEFYLRPRDVVFVTTLPLSRWNEAISKLLPSITGLYQLAYTRKNL
jgi:polysaccharide export outer membrane protein